MATTKITFPVVGKVHGETIRRNTETGVEIRSSKLDRGGMEHNVYYPTRDGMRLVNYFDTLSGAREEALDRAQVIRDEALAQVAEQARELAADAPLTDYARKQFPSVAVILDAAEVEPTFEARAYGIGTLWTNVETGVQISKFPREQFVVSIPIKGKHVEVVDVLAETHSFAEARTMAFGAVAGMRRNIEHAEAQALIEHFERFPLVADESVVFADGAVRKVWRTGHVLWLQSTPGDDDRMMQWARESAWPATPITVPSARLARLTAEAQRQLDNAKP